MLNVKHHTIKKYFLIQFVRDELSRATEAGRSLGAIQVSGEPGVGCGHEVGVLSGPGVHGACHAAQ